MNANRIETPAGEPVILITRRFDAPRALVYRCYTDPAHMAHFWGPRNTKTVTRIDRVAPGGVWRTSWTYEGGAQYSYTSVYLEVVAPERIVFRDAPNEWPGGLDGLPPVEILTTIAMAEARGGTELTVIVRCNSIADRDEKVRLGFADMVSVGNDRLEDYLKTLG